jgi:hypothetical protein
MENTDDTECRHGMDPRFCSICRDEDGYVPGSDRRRDDCTVKAIENLTGFDYEEIIDHLTDGFGYTPGRGMKADVIADALRDLGADVTEIEAVHPTCLPRTGRFYVSARTQKRGKGHSFAVVDGTAIGAGKYLRLYSVYVRVWRVTV